METNIQHIGKKIKSIRTTKGLTLKEMVQYTGLSLGYLSNLERDTTSPTLSVLEKICSALDISFSDLLYEPTTPQLLMKKEAARHDTYPEFSLDCQTVNYPDQDILVQVITLAPGTPQEIGYWRHKFSEICTVVSGTLKVIIEDQEYLLSEGDSLVIPAEQLHATVNAGEGPCISYWVHKKTRL